MADSSNYCNRHIFPATYEHIAVLLRKDTTPSADYPHGLFCALQSMFQTAESSIYGHNPCITSTEYATGTCEPIAKKWLCKAV
jgi:hypothetical protein